LETVPPASPIVDHSFAVPAGLEVAFAENGAEAEKKQVEDETSGKT
jgi:hypothetical protein